MLRLLGRRAGDLLRAGDAANRELGLTASSPEEELIRAMSLHPTLLQRPIGILRERAVLARPVERLLELLETPPEH